MTNCSNFAQPPHGPTVPPTVVAKSTGWLGAFSSNASIPVTESTELDTEHVKAVTRANLKTIFQAVHAISACLDWDTLVEQTAQWLLRYTQSDRGVLVLPDRAGQWQVRAIATPMQTELCATPLVASGALPVQLVQAVQTYCTGFVFEGDQATLPVVDAYFEQSPPAHAFCWPILQAREAQSAEVLGIFYGEYHQALTGVALGDRLVGFNELCTQVAIAFDNAERYQQAQTPPSSEASATRLQTVAANLPGMVYQFRLAPDGTTSFPYVSSGCLALYEVEPAAVMAGQQNLYLMHHPADHGRVEAAMWHSAQTLTPFFQEWRIITPSGLEKWVQGAARPDRQADGSVLWDGVILEVSNRKQLEAERQAIEVALRRSEERYRSLIEITSQVVWIATPDGRTVESPNWCTYTGQSLDKLKEFGWLEALHPDDIEYTGRVWNESRETKNWYKIEYRIRAANGEYRYFDVKGVPILAEDGTIREWIGSCTDIEDRKRAEAALTQRTVELEQTLAELRSAQTQMIQAEKMSALGQLVAGVAHEINNPVNFIYGNLSHANSYINDLLELIRIYQQHYPQPHPAVQTKTEAIDLEFVVSDLPKLLTSMQVGADRIQKIVASLRTFSRMDESEMKVVDIHSGIDSTLMILQHRLKAKANFPGIEIVKAYAPLPLVDCYAGQLNQVFMNLLSNAVDALEEAWAQEIVTTPTITVQTLMVSEQAIAIQFIDNGPSIPDSIKSRLFNPFFTTKAVGKGTGMGLSISYQIVVEKHRGTLTCDSDPTQWGNTFTVTIPIHQ